MNNEQPFELTPEEQAMEQSLRSLRPDAGMFDADATLRRIEAERPRSTRRSPSLIPFIAGAIAGAVATLLLVFVLRPGRTEFIEVEKIVYLPADQQEEAPERKDQQQPVETESAEDGDRKNPENNDRRGDLLERWLLAGKSERAEMPSRAVLFMTMARAEADHLSLADLDQLLGEPPEHRPSRRRSDRSALEFNVRDAEAIEQLLNDPRYGEG